MKINALNCSGWSMSPSNPGEQASLLAGLTGRSFGLPQQSGSSDVLAEAYLSVVERRLLRQGLSVWRYNDDFLIAADSWSAALNAVDALEREQYSVGFDLDERIRTAIAALPEHAWEPALDAAGAAREDAQVAEVTGLGRIRADRILHEALTTGADPLHLSLVFNIAHDTASRR